MAKKDRREEWKQYRETHVDRTNAERQRRFLERHKRDPDFVERQRAYQRDYRAKHCDPLRVKQSVTPEAKKANSAARSAAYYARNRDAINERRRAKRAAVKASTD